MKRAAWLLLLALAAGCAHRAPSKATQRMLADDDKAVDVSLAGTAPVAIPAEPSPFGTAAMAQDAVAATAQPQTRPQPLPDEPKPPR
jgi:hypothetical protein